MGSRREPKRLLVLRTPFTTARTLPWPSVTMLTMRSASPSRIVRSTTPWSRYSDIGLALHRPEAAVAALELAHRFEEVLAPEVGPQHVGEHQLAVGQLPQQEVGDAELARRADHEVGVGHVGQVQARPDRLLVDLVGLHA